MPHASRRNAGRSTASSRRAKAKPKDAVALLKADHRQVEEWFEQFEKSRSDQKKADLAGRICQALTVHATIEEEIFYPAFLEATGDEELHLLTEMARQKTRCSMLIESPA